MRPERILRRTKRTSSWLIARFWDEFWKDVREKNSKITFFFSRPGKQWKIGLGDVEGSKTSSDHSATRPLLVQTVVRKDSRQHCILLSARPLSNNVRLLRTKV